MLSIHPVFVIKLAPLHCGGEEVHPLRKRGDDFALSYIFSPAQQTLPVLIIINYLSSVWFA